MITTLKEHHQKAKLQSALSQELHDGTSAASDPPIIIDPEFKILIPPHSEKERKHVEAELVATRRCRYPLVIWKGRGILLDGHMRYELCRKHNIPFDMITVDLPDREAARKWIINAQLLSQRNLTPDQISYLRGLLYNDKRLTHGGDRKGAGSTAQNEPMKNTAELLAEQTGVSAATIKRDARFAAAVDKLATAAGPEVKQKILDPKSGLSKQDVVKLAKGDDADRKKAVQEFLENGKKPREAKRQTSPKVNDNQPQTDVAAPAQVEVAQEAGGSADQKSIHLDLSAGPKAIAQTLGQALLGHFGREDAERVLEDALRQVRDNQNQQQADEPCAA